MCRLTEIAQQRWWRRLRQDLRVFIHLFPWRVAMALVVGIAGIAGLFQHAYQALYPNETFSYVKAIYAVLNMISFQVSFDDIPQHTELDVFFVLTPLIGIPLFLIFGANIINILRIFFVRGERGQLWQSALAATIGRPIVICGLGRVGYRIADQLLDLQRPVIGIDIISSPLVDKLIERDMPVILGDARNEEVLRSAGVERATSVLVCTNQDLINIEATFYVRELNPQAEIILRLFEDEIANEIKSSFNLKAVISRSAIAAQAFAHAAIGLEVLETFELDGQTYLLAKVPLGTASPLVEGTIHTAAKEQQATVICLYREGRIIVEPNPETVLRVGDTLFIFTRAGMLAPLITRPWKESGSPPLSPPQREGNVSAGGPIIVCGLGHTGYRVVNELNTLKRPVIALDFESSRLAERLQEGGMPVTFGDFRQRSMLEQAGIKHASALIACTDDDMINLETVLRARELSANLRVVMRIFEEALGRQLQQSFSIDAVYSTSAIATPAFVSEVLKIHLAQPVEVGGEQHFIARMVIEPVSNLLGDSIKSLNQQDDLTVLLHTQKGKIYVPPLQNQVLGAGDEIVVLASREKLRNLTRRNISLWDIV